MTARYSILLILTCLLVLGQGCKRGSLPAASAQSDQVSDLSSPYSDVFTGMTFDTRIESPGRQISGLMHLRQVRDGVWRVAMTAKVGQTMFDFEFDRDTFAVLRCIEQMNRRVVLEYLETDLRLITGLFGRIVTARKITSEEGVYRRFQVAGDRGWWHHEADSLGVIKSTGYGKKRKIKAIAEFGAYSDGLPRQVHIDHRTIVNFEIEMRMIQ